MPDTIARFPDAVRQSITRLLERNLAIPLSPTGHSTYQDDVFRLDQRWETQTTRPGNNVRVTLSLNATGIITLDTGAVQAHRAAWLAEASSAEDVIAGYLEDSEGPSFERAFAKSNLTGFDLIYWTRLEEVPE